MNICKIISIIHVDMITHIYIPFFVEQKQNNHGQGIRTCNPKVAATSGISKGEVP